MSIAGTLEGMPAFVRQGFLKSQCAVARYRAEHPDVSPQVREAISRTDKSSTITSDVFKAHGLDVSSWVVRYHRRGECRSCGSLNELEDWYGAQA